MTFSPQKFDMCNPPENFFYQSNLPFYDVATYRWLKPPVFQTNTPMRNSNPLKFLLLHSANHIYDIDNYIRTEGRHRRILEHVVWCERISCICSSIFRGIHQKLVWGRCCPWPIYLYVEPSCPRDLTVGEVVEMLPGCISTWVRGCCCRCPQH